MGASFQLGTCGQFGKCISAHGVRKKRLGLKVGVAPVGKLGGFGGRRRDGDNRKSGRSPDVDRIGHFQVGDNPAGTRIDELECRYLRRRL
jgi:hypothetical protein